jgi:putative thioredoxin
VLVDFWAPWCAPCRMFGPVLEQVAAAWAGRLEVVKVNTDESPEVAARYRIRGIPAVKLFAGGEVIAERVGALPERQVVAFLEEHLPSEASAAARRAAAALADGDRAAARQAAEAGLAAGATGAAAATAHAVLARVALAERAFDEAAAHARAVPAAAPEWDQAQAIGEAVELARDALAAGAGAPRAPGAATTPEDRFAGAIHRFLDGEARGALDDLLALVEDHRRWRDEAARKAMLVLFRLLGIRSPISDEYRRRLALLL